MSFHNVICLTLPQITDFKLSQIETVCRGQFKFDEKSSKFSKRVENTVGKEEIARYEQFLLYPHCFLKGLFPRGVKRCHCVGMG